jgi:hypothetical protein
MKAKNISSSKDSVERKKKQGQIQRRHLQTFSLIKDLHPEYTKNSYTFKIRGKKL